ncbi:MAG: PTS system mannose/fructose/sorbose family transporter subunit IID [Gemmatimonadetes bacterium]|nr:PTS system mannose/fructose/sorbose family transporter subunit IID [Gemmatimonadota bacterium]
MSALSRRAITSTFLRSFLVQGSWNYHTMIGTGFAFAMLPGLRRIFDDDAKAMDASVRRHLDHFNAHPYLANVALGAALRLEADGTDAQTVRRFKTAVRGPLGGLGDSLVWAAWLPTVSMAALAMWWIGLPVWVVVGLFLVLYNAGHLALRIWGFRSGLRDGRDVARTLSKARLAQLAERIKSIASLLVGVLAGVLLAGRGGLSDGGLLWLVVAIVCFVVGLVVGHRIWRPAAIATVTAIALIAAWGVLQ